MADVTIAGRFGAVLERVGAAAERSGRAREDVTVVAVAKTFPVEAIEQVVAAGATDIGENRAQELAQKNATLGGRVRWHFVGPLQTNKVRLVVGVAALIHSVDRWGLAEAIGRRARGAGVTQDVLIEVNVAAERTKHGIEPARAIDLAQRVDDIDGVAVRGLMAIPPAADDPEASRHHFTAMASLSEDLRSSLPEATALSMGMTGDFEVAIEEGATIVRVGEAVFGPRATGR